MIASPQAASLYFWGPTSFHGVSRNNPRSLAQALRLSTRPWSIPQSSSCGSRPYFVSYAYNLLTLLDCGATTEGPSICLLI
jgi:hypothetical protein